MKMKLVCIKFFMKHYNFGNTKPEPPIKIRVFVISMGLYSMKYGTKINANVHVHVDGATFAKEL